MRLELAQKIQKYIKLVNTALQDLNKNQMKSLKFLWHIEKTYKLSEQGSSF